MKNLLVTLICFCFSIQIFGQEKISTLDYQLGEVLVQFKPEINAKNFVQIFNENHTGFGAIFIKKTTAKNLNIYLIGLSNLLKTNDLLTVFENKNEILAAQLNYRLEFRDSIPNDNLFGDQWGLERIEAAAVWSESTGGTTAAGDEIVVAILDKGYDIDHEDFQGNLWVNAAEIPDNGVDDDLNGLEDDIHGWDFTNNTPDFIKDAHGTAVAGIVGAKGNNGAGISGVNWNIKLMLLRTVFVDDIVAGYNYVLEQRQLYNNTNGAQGAFVVATNASLGLNNTFCNEFPIWGAMYDLLGAAGVVNVTATTNAAGTDVEQGGDMPTTCTSPFIIAVTNSDMEDEREGGFGEVSIDLSAPGTGTLTTAPNSDYDPSFGGTSAACPHVAGAVALLYSLPCMELGEIMHSNPGGAALLVKEAILEGIDPVVSMEGETVTGGRLNVYSSMLYLHTFCISDEQEKAEREFFEKYQGEQNFINIYPNPVGDFAKKLFIDFKTIDFQPISIQVFNALGQLVIEDDMKVEPFESQTYEMNVFNLARGAYFVMIAGIDDKITVKFLK